MPLPKRWTDEKIAYLKYLRFEKYQTLDEIGRKVGVSRERIRQIIGNSGYIIPEWKHGVIKKNPDRTNEELAEMLGYEPGSIASVRGNTFHKDKQGRYDWIIHVGEFLESLGHSVEYKPYRVPYDILLNGKTKIKIALARRWNHSERYGLVSDAYRFHLRSGSDFTIGVALEYGDIFVFPKVEFGRVIRFVWPSNPHKSVSKWAQYHNRWEMIT